MICVLLAATAQAMVARAAAFIAIILDVVVSVGFVANFKKGKSEVMLRLVGPGSQVLRTDIPACGFCWVVRAFLAKSGCRRKPNHGLYGLRAAPRRWGEKMPYHA